MTYYRISQLLGVTSAYMSRLRDGAAIMSPAMAQKLAELADLPAAYVVACIEHERAEREHNADLSGTWRAIADAFAKHAAAVIVAVAVLAGLSVPAPSYAAGAGAVGSDDLYIMRSRKRRRGKAAPAEPEGPGAAISALLRQWGRPGARAA